MFKTFRGAYPNILKYVFNREAAKQRQVAEEEEKVIFVMPVMTDEEVGTTFDGSGRGDQHNYGAKLKLLRQVARDIADDTISDAETSVDQLAKNLRSIIGQKAAEMNLLYSLVTRDSQEIKTYYEDIFEHHSGYEEICTRDIEEAAVLVRRSRQIFLAFMAAHEFEETFTKMRAKIPKTFFMRSNIHLPKKTQAMIFTIRYIKGRKSQAKSVKQSLKKNCTFKAFAFDVNDIIFALTDLLVLKIEQRQVRMKRLVNGEPVVRNAGFYVPMFDDKNEAHRVFLEQFQGVYPGELFT